VIGFRIAPWVTRRCAKAIRSEIGGCIVSLIQRSIGNEDLELRDSAIRDSNREKELASSKLEH